MGGAAARGGRRAAPGAARAGRRDRRRAEPRRARLRAPARGPVRPGAPHRGGGGARPLHDDRREPRRRSGGRARGVREPGPGGDARGPEPRRAARRLPAGGAGGLAKARGGRRAGRSVAPHPLHARRGDLRLHRRALRGLDRGIRAGADRRGGCAPAPPPAAGRAARAGAAGGAGDRRGRGCRTRPGGCPARSPSSSWRRTTAAREPTGSRSGSVPRRSWLTCLRSTWP